MANGRLSTSQLVIFAGVMAVVSIIVQFAIAIAQTKYRSVSQCSCKNLALPSSANFEAEYSWKRDDYPAYLPLDLGDPVALVLEDSRHYSLNGPDADAEWESVYPGRGLGFIRLGPDKRFFSLSMYHQIHCLDSLRRAILGQSHQHGRSPDAAKRDVEHSAHCLNYLRQTVLCASDLTLESEIVEGSSDVGEGLAATHVCRDWSKVHEFVQQNWEEWEAWQKVNGTM